jgi:hypothetical protein
MQGNEAMTDIFSTDQPRSNLARFTKPLLLVVLCLIGAMVVWQLSVLNESVQRQNHLLANHNAVQADLVNITNNISRSLAEGQRMGQAQTPNYTNLIGTLLMEVRQLREGMEKQKGK